MPDPNLNETGRINMGDSTELHRSPSLILDSHGQQTSSQFGTDRLNEATQKARELYRPEGVSWHLDEEATKEEGRDMWFPHLSIKSLGQKLGASRPFKQFMPDERNMLVQAFMNDCGAFLFNVEPFLEEHTEQGVVMTPNPEWANLPVENE